MHSQNNKVIAQSQAFLCKLILLDTLKKNHYHFPITRRLFFLGSDNFGMDGGVAKSTGWCSPGLS